MRDLTNEEANALLDCWEAWDLAPTNTDRVHALELTLKAAAAALDTTTTSLRIALLAAKVETGSYAAALAAVRSGRAASAST